MAKRLVFPEKQKVALEKCDPPPVTAETVLVRALYTQMSTGTENIVFNRLYEKGSHWDQWIKFPFHPGYSFVGEIEKVGPAVESLKAGDRIVALAGHGSLQLLNEKDCFKLPPQIDLKDAVWYTLAKVAFMGARAARHVLGDGVLIIGAGPVGQMSVRWAFCAGVETLIVIDSVPMRLEMAKRGGATGAVARPAEEALEEIKALFGGQQPGIVIDTTGNSKVLTSALKIAAFKGRVVLLGDTGSPTEQHLTLDVITRGLTITGAHGMHDDEKWNSRTIQRLWANMALSGRFKLGGLNTHIFVPEDCEKAYELANTRRSETMGILFDWTKS